MTRTLERFGTIVTVTTSTVLVLSAARRPVELTIASRTEARIAELERRIVMLESERVTAAQVPSTVKAPFTVVDNAGNRIFTVDAVTHGWALYSVTGSLGVTASAGPSTGSMTALAAESGHAVNITAFSQSAGIEIDDTKQMARVKLGVTTKGQTELSLLDAGHNEIARFGEIAGGSRLEAKSTDRHRIAVVGAEGGKATLALQDAPGSDRVSATFDGHSQLAVMGGGHKPVVELMDQADGGAVDVNDKNGTTLISAYNSAGGGRIRARNASSTQSIMLAAMNSGTEVSILQGTNEESRQASLMVVKDKPELALFADQKNKILDLVQGDNGGGRLTLADASGKVHALGYAGPDAGVFQAMTPSEDRIALLGAQAGVAVFAVKDSPKSSRGSLSLTNDGRSSLAIMNSVGNNVVLLSQGAAGAGGAGTLQLGAASGGTTVEAGTLPSGAGIVRVGPQYKCAGSSLGGLSVPDCIKGHP